MPRLGHISKVIDFIQSPYCTGVKTAVDLTMYCLQQKQSKLHSTNEDCYDTITKLKFIGRLQPHEKINVRQLYVQPSNLMTSISRIFFQESRENTLGFLSGTMTRALELIEQKLSSSRVSDRLLLENVISDIHGAIDGLRNIQMTYSSDRIFHCRIESLIEEIVSKLDEYRLSHPAIFQKVIPSGEKNVEKKEE